ncbi:unnamed protein product [Urochloa humidicola]
MEEREQAAAGVPHSAPALATRHVAAHPTLRLSPHAAISSIHSPLR